MFVNVLAEWEVFVRDAKLPLKFEHKLTSLLTQVKQVWLNIHWQAQINN